MISLYDYCTKYHLGDYYNRNMLKRIRKLAKRSHKIENFTDFLEYDITIPEWKDRHLSGGKIFGFICKFKDPLTHYHLFKFSNYSYDVDYSDTNFKFNSTKIENLKKYSI